MRMRRRNMYNATGLPGWMRRGHGPNQARRGRGMGPCGRYLMAGQWPTPQVAAAMQGMPGVQIAPQHQVALLQAQLDTLEQQIGAVRQQIADIGRAE